MVATWTDRAQVEWKSPETPYEKFKLTCIPPKATDANIVHQLVSNDSCTEDRMCTANCTGLTSGVSYKANVSTVRDDLYSESKESTNVLITSKYTSAKDHHGSKVSQISILPLKMYRISPKRKCPI